MAYAIYPRQKLRNVPVLESPLFEILLLTQNENLLMWSHLHLSMVFLLVHLKMYVIHNSLVQWIFLIRLVFSPWIEVLRKQMEFPLLICIACTWGFQTLALFFYEHCQLLCCWEGNKFQPKECHRRSFRAWFLT